MDDSSDTELSNRVLDQLARTKDESASGTLAKPEELLESPVTSGLEANGNGVETDPAETSAESGAETDSAETSLEVPTEDDVESELTEVDIAEAKAKVAQKRADHAEELALKEAEAKEKADAQLAQARRKAEKADVKAKAAAERAERTAVHAEKFAAEAEAEVEKAEVETAEVEKAEVEASAEAQSTDGVAADGLQTEVVTDGGRVPETTSAAAPSPVASAAVPIVAENVEPTATAAAETKTANAETDKPESKDEPDNTDDTESAVEETKSLSWRDRLHEWSQNRTGMHPEDRLRVMEAVGIHRAGGWAVHFTLMMLLSVVVAAMGLSANSAAVVIGAMLLAPLMTPVMGTAASLTMADGKQLFRSIVVLILATVGAILLSFLVALILPDTGLTNEILARTRPDVRDLFVALAAGAAGAYAISQPNLSGSLPGVAIAVALVPPLAAVGITLEAGEFELARGALLLYITNLVAIIALGFVVFVATGFAPPWRLAAATPQVLLGGGLALIGTVAVAIPLVLTSLNASTDARERQEMSEAIDGWLDGTGNSLDGFEVRGDEVIVSIRGPEQPRAKGTLQENIRAIRERPNTLVEVQWAQSYRTPDSDELTEEEQEALERRQQEIAIGERAETTRRVIDEWWAASNGETKYRITSLEQDPESLVVDIASTIAPPDVRDLAERLLAEELTPLVDVTWTELTRITVDEPDEASEETPEEAEATSVDEVTRQLEIATSSWLRGQPALSSSEVFYDGNRVVVDLIGQRAPSPAQISSLEAALEAQLEAAGQPASDISIFFTPRRQLNPTPPTTSGPATTTTTSSTTTTTAATPTTAGN